MDESRNEYSHLDWRKGDIPRDRPGNYLVYLDKPSLGNRIASCRAMQGMSAANGTLALIVTINSQFEFDCGNRKILAWVPTADLEPDLELLK